jgi:thiosulfate/3-mercaptopyruvate sulfurtransferase
MSVALSRYALLASLLFAPAASPSLLITPAQLVKELSDPSLVLLQVGPRENYDSGHVKGARFITMQDLAAARTDSGPMLELPDTADLRARIEKLGIGNKSHIVVIAGADWASPSTRIVWTLQVAGLGAQTRWLDGGLDGWKRAGYPLTTAVPPAPTPGHLTLPEDRALVVNHQWMQAHLDAPGVRIIDARSPVFFEGVGMPEHNAPAGHLEGAHNIPFNTLMDDSLEVLPLSELARIFADAGVQKGDTVAAYCHVGQQATVVIFAARLLGYPAVLYDGSATEWQSLKLPMVNPNPTATPHE